jgi:gliding motility-associated lipoprotein GldD
VKSKAFHLNKIAFILLTAISALFCTCTDDDEIYSPKPRGYFRIDMPAKDYRTYDSLCPFKFEIPLYSKITKDPHKGAEPCWLNLEIPRFKATVYLSYKEVDNNIAAYLDDAHDLANRHQIKATGLDEIAILRDSAKVYGLLFDIAGNTATSLQFYLTDSTRHFLRGSLYFNAKPNIDSLRIIVDFIKKDVIHLINSTCWKND